MKFKIALIAAISVLGACSILSDTGTAVPTTTTGKLKACSFEEAGSMIKSGKAFTQSISVSADEISEACLKKLALQSAGLEGQATSDATSALQTLLNAASGKK
ncbi:MAG: hypothetical protein LBR70_03440 [Lactobacillaceae bacterium]|nr:hypothetical protein [Lactobacillaceae bacterium]